MLNLEIKKALNILGLTNFIGGEKYFLMSCPFWRKTHGKPDRNPSFYISTKGGGFAKCFSCGYRSTLLDFLDNYSKYIGQDFNFDYIENYVYLDFDKDVDIENVVLDEGILDIFSTDQKPVAKYLESRGIDSQFLNFPMLFDEQYKNIVCPVRNRNQDLVGATGRSIVQKSHHHYFGFSTSAALIGLEQKAHNSVIIVEGLTDFLNLKAKIKELDLQYDVVGTMTCSVSNWQAIRIIDNWKQVYLAYDLDKAGISARPEAIKKLKDCLYLYDISWDYKNQDGKLKDIGDFSKEEVKQIFA